MDIRVRRAKPLKHQCQNRCMHTLLRWIGHSLPEWVTRDRQDEGLFQRLSQDVSYRDSNLLFLEFKDPIARPLTTMMLETGLRVSEACNMDVEDIDLDDLSALVIGGKGEKDRTVLFTGLTSSEIESWLIERKLRGMLMRKVEDAPFSYLRVEVEYL